MTIMGQKVQILKTLIVNDRFLFLQRLLLQTKNQKTDRACKK